MESLKNLEPKIFLKSLRENFAELFFPPICPLCRNELLREDEELCEGCLSGMELIKKPYCLICGMQMESKEAISHICIWCEKEKPYFSKARAYAIFDFKMVETIHRFKFAGWLSLAKFLAKGMINIYKEELKDDNYEVVIPVPLHWRRLLTRGFNQSAVLASAMARELNLRLELYSLKRVKNTKPQYGLTRRERKENVKNAFKVINNAKVKGKRILLVDDVYTTGATVGECSKVLKKAGADMIGVLTLARAN